MYFFFCLLFLNSFVLLEEDKREKISMKPQKIRSHFLHFCFLLRYSDNNHCFKRRITELARTFTKALQPLRFRGLQYL